MLFTAKDLPWTSRAAMERCCFQERILCSRVRHAGSSQLPAAKHPPGPPQLSLQGQVPSGWPSLMLTSDWGTYWVLAIPTPPWAPLVGNLCSRSPPWVPAPSKRTSKPTLHSEILPVQSCCHSFAFSKERFGAFHAQSHLAPSFIFWKHHLRGNLLYSYIHLSTCSPEDPANDTVCSNLGYSVVKVIPSYS